MGELKHVMKDGSVTDVKKLNKLLTSWNKKLQCGIRIAVRLRLWTLSKHCSLHASIMIHRSQSCVESLKSTEPCVRLYWFMTRGRVSRAGMPSSNTKMNVICTLHTSMPTERKSMAGEYSSMLNEPALSKDGYLVAWVEASVELGVVDPK